MCIITLWAHCTCMYLYCLKNYYYYFLLLFKSRYNIAERLLHVLAISARQSLSLYAVTNINRAVNQPISPPTSHRISRRHYTGKSRLKVVYKIHGKRKLSQKNICRRSIIHDCLTAIQYMHVHMHMRAQARNQGGGSGGSSEPPFSRTPLPKIRTPPPAQTFQLHIWHRIPNMPVSGVVPPIEHTEPTSWVLF